MATRIEIYQQAVLDLERAVSELDQVHASLKDIGFDQITISSVGRLLTDPRTILNLVDYAEAMLKELRIAACPDCEHLIDGHEKEGGCPCGCRWGFEDVGARHALSRMT